MVACLFWASPGQQDTPACVRESMLCCVYIHIVFMYVYTQNTGHATKEVSQPFTEAHKPQRGAQRTSARVFDGICPFLKTTRFLPGAAGETDARRRARGRPCGAIHLRQSPNSLQPQAPARGSTVGSAEKSPGKLKKRGHVCPMETVVGPVGLTPPRRALPETC